MGVGVRTIQICFWLGFRPLSQGCRGDGSKAFAVLVGLHIRMERQIEPAKRVLDINSRLVQPAETLLKTLRDADFSKEFTASWGGALGNVDTDPLIDVLENLLNQARQHIAKIKATGKRGKSWDSDLKDHFIDMVAILCEFIDRKFEPTAAVGPSSLPSILLRRSTAAMTRLSDGWSDAGERSPQIEKVRLTPIHSALICACSVFENH